MGKHRIEGMKTGEPVNHYSARVLPRDAVTLIDINRRVNSFLSLTFIERDAGEFFFCQHF